MKNNGAYRCKCTAAWAGRNCNSFDPCMFMTPCKNGGSCSTNDDGAYTCSCTAAWTGHTCQETNYCASNPCRNGATCEVVSRVIYKLPLYQCSLRYALKSGIDMYSEPTLRARPHIPQTPTQIQFWILFALKIIAWFARFKIGTRRTERASLYV